MLKADIEFELEKYQEAETSIRKAAMMDPSLKLQEKIKKYIKMSKMSQRKDYYKILNIKRDASHDTIKKSYRDQAFKKHPDRNSSTNAKSEF